MRIENINAESIKDIEIQATIKYKADNKTLLTLKSNTFSILNGNLTDIKITGTAVVKSDFRNGTYEVRASETFKIVPVSNGDVYFMTIKIKDSRYTLAGALLASFVGVFAFQEEFGVFKVLGIALVLGATVICSKE